jgi:NAD(P)H-hydrate epimerase
MASAGSGDILAGVVGSLLAQGLAPFEAACCAALVHARAADIVVQQYGERGLLATDLLPEIRHQVNQ